MVERKCWCGKVFLAKEADVKRGWAKACSKSHAAHAREKNLDRFNYKQGGSKPNKFIDDDYADAAAMDAIEDGWDGHKNAF